MDKQKAAFKSVDEYIASFPVGTQKLLEEIRSGIKLAAPEAQERISYNIPTFTLNGKPLIYFAGWKNHISVYPVPAGDDQFNQAIASYIDGKGTLKFPLDKPLPMKLVEEAVKFRMADHPNDQYPHKAG